MRKNIVFALLVLLVAGALALALYTGRAGGAQARVSIADGEGFALSLREDGLHSYGTDTGARLPFTLEIKDGSVRFVDSKCPDHVCEGFGWLSHEFDEAVCLPAGVVVRVENPS